MNDIQTASTIAVKQPEMPLISRKDVRVGPIYIWKNDVTIVPSKKEQVVLDAYLKNFSFAEAGDALAAYMPWRGIGKHEFRKLAKRWLTEKDQMKAYVEQHLRDRGVAREWTEERWMAVAHDDIQGINVLTPGARYMMSLIAKVRNWNVQSGMNLGNMSINIVQQNGKE